MAGDAIVISSDEEDDDNLLSKGKATPTTTVQKSQVEKLHNQDEPTGFLSSTLLAEATPAIKEHPRVNSKRKPLIVTPDISNSSSKYRKTSSFTKIEISPSDLASVLKGNYLLNDKLAAVTPIASNQESKKRNLLLQEDGAKLKLSKNRIEHIAKILKAKSINNLSNIDRTPDAEPDSGVETNLGKRPIVKALEHVSEPNKLSSQEVSKEINRNSKLLCRNAASESNVGTTSDTIGTLEKYHNDVTGSENISKVPRKIIAIKIGNVSEDPSMSKHEKHPKPTDLSEIGAISAVKNKVDVLDPSMSKHNKRPKPTGSFESRTASVDKNKLESLRQKLTKQQSTCVESNHQSSLPVNNTSIEKRNDTVIVIDDEESVSYNNRNDSAGLSTGKYLSPKTLHKHKVRALEVKLERMERMINRFSEVELSYRDMDSEESAYLSEAKVKERFLKTWRRYCVLIGENPDEHISTRKRVKVSSSPFPEVNRAVEKYVNRADIFPNLFEIKQVCLEANEKYNLNIKLCDLHHCSVDIFSEVGQKLQKNREKVFRQTSGNVVTDRVKIEDDPALKDPVLKKQLKQNRRLGKQRFDQVFSDFVRLQYEQESSGIGSISTEATSQSEEDEEKNFEETLHKLHHSQTIENKKMKREVLKQTLAKDVSKKNKNEKKTVISVTLSSKKQLINKEINVRFDNDKAASLKYPRIVISPLPPCAEKCFIKSNEGRLKTSLNTDNHFIKPGEISYEKKLENSLEKFKKEYSHEKQKNALIKQLAANNVLGFNEPKKLKLDSAAPLTMFKKSQLASTNNSNITGSCFIHKENISSSPSSSSMPCSKQKLSNSTTSSVDINSKQTGCNKATLSEFGNNDIIMISDDES